MRTSPSFRLKSVRPTGYALACGFLAALAGASTPAAADTYLAKPVAHYPLARDAQDATGNNGAMQLEGVVFDDGALYSAGTYDSNSAATPQLGSWDLDRFAIGARFYVSARESRTVFMAGRGHRWLGLETRDDGSLAIIYNNSESVACDVRYRVDEWNRVLMTYHRTGGRIALLVDGRFACAREGVTLDHNNERSVMITNYSSGSTFKGWIADLEVIGEAKVGGPPPKTTVRKPPVSVPPPPSTPRKPPVSSSQPLRKPPVTVPPPPPAPPKPKPAPFDVREAYTVQADRTGVTAVALSPDGGRLATAGWENTLKVWDARTGQPALAVGNQGNGDLLLSVAFSPDGRRLVTGSRDYETNTHTVKVWDARTGAEALALKSRPSNFCSSTAWSPDNLRIAAGCWDTNLGQLTLAVWSANSGDVSLLLPEIGAPVAFSPDGSSFLGSTGQTIEVRDSSSGAVRARLAASRVISAAWSADGRWIATGGADGSVKLWNAQTGEERGTLGRHGDRVDAVAIRADGRLLATGANDGSLTVWDTNSGEAKKTISLPKGVASLAFSPDGNRLTAGTASGAIRIYELSGAL